MGQTELCTDQPQHLPSMSPIPLVQVAAGGEQSFALSVSGGVFGWGRNDCGQLGLGNKTGEIRKRAKSMAFIIDGTHKYDVETHECHSFCKVKAV